MVLIHPSAKTTTRTGPKWPDYQRKVKHVKEYELIVNQHHMAELLEALRGHYIAAENAPGTSEQVKGICADLLRRAELLDAIVEAGDDLREAQEAYDHYIQYGDAPTVAPVKVVHRLI